MTAWADLVAAGVVGTERRAVDVRLPALDGTGIDGREATVLAAAAVLATQRRAGRRPERARPTLPAAPDDPRPDAAPAAAQILDLLLGGDVRVAGGSATVLREWLARCVASGRRVPRAAVPALLASATAEPDLRAVASDAIGPLAAWLGALNPDWGWAVGVTGADAAATGDGAVTEQVWATASRDERLRMLRTLHAADPPTARQLLDSTWTTEAAADRASFLEALAGALTDDDEPFLDAALDDRAKSVRAVASALLDSVPRSRRAERMAERVRPLVSMEGRLRKRIAVALPDELDAAARRDGVVDDGKPSGLGQRAWWFAQLVRGTALDVWPALLGAPPRDLLGRGAPPELLIGWRLAAVAQRDVAWIESLFAHQPSVDLLRVLDASTAQRAVAGVWRSIGDNALAPVVGSTAGPWTLEFSTMVVARYRKLGTKAPMLPTIVHALAAQLHPGAAADVERWIGDLADDEYSRRQVRTLHHALTLRQTIAEEFR